ncbi:F-box family protein [Rhynchospora pubera]|uniref:F-box family protein n=1 Tax=Rhynchospora pubera TaxID=906938 RepID=A0AAV8BWE8_9POAL|nr:F-box family protein [Rhynchospora pubera]
MESSPSASPDWASLPKAAVLLISQKVKSITDYVRFRAVCSPWRAASFPKPTHLPPQLPWLMMPWCARNTSDDGVRLFYDLWESKLRKLHLPDTIGMVCCATGCGWLLLVSTKPEKVFLLNPITRARINLPFFATPVKYVEEHSDDSRFMHNWSDLYFTFTRLTFSANPTDPKCLITAFFKEIQEMVSCHPTDTCWKWLDIRMDPPKKFEDATYYNGLFYVLYEEMLLVYDSNKLENRVLYPWGPNIPAGKKFLVEGKSGLYVVLLDDFHKEVMDEVDEDTEECFKQRIDLYHFEEQQLKFKKVTDKSNTMLFYGTDNRPYLAVSSDDWDSLDGGSVYMSCRFKYDRGLDFLFGVHKAKLDDCKFNSICKVDDIGKGPPKCCPSATTLWFQPSFC